MKLNNEKGIWTVPMWAASKGAIAGYVLVNKIAWGAIVLACIWHIPAWDVAKANGTEKAYQAQQMFPQELFAKLPGGNIVVHPTVVAPTGGYWEEKFNPDVKGK